MITITKNCIILNRDTIVPIHLNSLDLNVGRILYTDLNNKLKFIVWDRVYIEVAYRVREEIDDTLYHDNN